MIVVVSNRNVNRGADDHTAFGDDANVKGLDELRIATAVFDEGAARDLDAQNAVYFDFTDGRDVGSTHGIFYKTAKKNDVVREIFQRALTGRRAEVVSGIVQSPRTGAYELVDKV